MVLNHGGGHKKERGSSSGMLRMREKFKKVTDHMKGKTPLFPPKASAKVASPKTGSVWSASVKTQSAETTSTNVLSTNNVPTKTVSTKKVRFKRESAQTISLKTSKSMPPVAAPAVAVAITPSAIRTRSEPTSNAPSLIDYSAENYDDRSSDLGMVSIDLETPPKYPKNGPTTSTATARPPTEQTFSPSRNEHKSASGLIRLRIHDKDNDTNKIESRMAARATSLMTPDMLDTLRVVEGDENLESRPEHQESESGRDNIVEMIPSPEPTRQSSTSTSREKKASKKKKGLKDRRSLKEKKKKKKNYNVYNDTGSCFYFADDDDTKVSVAYTCSTSSSSTSDLTKATFDDLTKETCDNFLSDETCDYISQYPCPGKEDWKYEVADDESNSYVQFRGDYTAKELDPFSFTGMILAMPVACGLLCIDNILDTDFFDVAIGRIPNSSDTRDKRSKSSYKKTRKKKRKERGEAHTPDAVGENDALPSLPCLLL
eukprot:CAMPEP_0197180514 /NCGR_PEP_ID=MMETSP1423-20130617/5098_1 /TAXON_ID=476441 /ORGANISM="Pseudo-nitzschia heimii, Strain UNC1101" /LENGTH=486 /DNA_ID=CAMNT_0042630601 /DNA_START=401 /DNA_END=1861 /DNA_ORIENTATION=-